MNMNNQAILDVLNSLEVEERNGGMMLTSW